MTAPRVTFDTNILVYSAAKERGEKHLKAADSLSFATNRDCVLTLQSLAEFYHATGRKNLVTAEKAMALINFWRELFPIVTANPSTLTEAIHLKATHKISFWDAMLIATAQDAGVQYLLSEDLNHLQQIGRVKIINPFLSDSWKE